VVLVNKPARPVAPRPERTGPTVGPDLPTAQPGEFVPWLLVGAFAFVRGLVPLGDPDVWWHLRTGEWIVDHRALPHSDPWSFASGRQWIPHEWLSQLAMYTAYALGGYHGGMALHALLLAVIAATVVRQARRRSGWLVTTCVTIGCLIGVSPGANERPQLASFALLAYFGPRLLRAIDDGKPPWIFVPLIFVWANLHGLWAAAIVLYGAVVLARAVQLGRRWRVAVPFVVVGAGMVVVAAVTPSGPRLLLTPLTVRSYARFSSEWVAPSIFRVWTLACLALLAVVVCGWARSGRRVPVTELAYVVTACLIGFGYNRTLPVAAVLLAPLAASALAGLTRSPATAHPWPAPLKAIAGVVAVGAVLATAAYLPSARGIESIAASPAASRRLDALPGHARVLNEYEFGGWLLWNARDVSPGVDGRTEIYRAAYIQRYYDTLALRGNWRGFVGDEQFGAAWLYRQTPLAGGLVDELHWKSVWSDQRTVILVPPDH